MRLENLDQAAGGRTQRGPFTFREETGRRLCLPKGLWGTGEGRSRGSGGPGEEGAVFAERGVGGRDVKGKTEGRGTR